jgi:HEAT repeat protein
VKRAIGVWAVAAATALSLLSGCPENPYSADTWIEKLDNPKEVDRAVTELEHLCDPKAIPALGKAWERNNKPTRILQVLIDLARPLTAGKGGQADEKFCTDFVEKGRPASWDKALPFLRAAIEDFESQSQRSIDNAVKAAEALGESQLEDGIQILIDAVNRKMQPKDNGQRVRLTAIAALGKYKSKQAIQTLANVIRADVTSQPPQIVGAAINTIGEMRAPESVPILLEAMYRVPVFFQQVRRALVASGPEAAPELRKILKHEHGDINALFKEKKLDKYCGDDGKAAPSDCQEVSAMDYYAAIVIGDLYDTQSVDVLLEALKRPMKPAYFSDFNAGPPAQNAVLDSLRKIGDPKSASAVLGIVADAKADERLRPIAATVYGFVAKDESGLGTLGKIIADNSADQALRLAAAESYGRIASSKDKIEVLKGLAKKYADASSEARKKADAEPKKAFDAANKQFEAANKALADSKAAVEKAKAEAGGDVAKVPDAVLTAATKAKEAFDKIKKEVYLPAKEKYDVLDQQAKGYTGYQRGFENHIARVEIAVRCGDDAACYVGAFDAKPADVFAKLKDGKYIDVKDEKAWTEDDKNELQVAQIERAVVELRRMGEKARPHLGKLLDKAVTTDRLIRQSILLALPKIAPLPCPDCEAKLDTAIKAGQGKQELSELNYETQLVRNYFSWAGKGKAEK